MKHFFLPLLIFAITSLYCISTHAQQVNKLSLENIYQSGKYSMKGINAVRWVGEDSYTALEKNLETGGRDIVSYNVKTGDRKIVVSSSKLVPNNSTTPLPINDYSWSKDNSKLLVFTNSKRVWRYNTRGDYWIMDTKKGTLSQIGKGMEPSNLMFAKFSPDGEKIAYVYKNDIYVENLSDSKINRLTYDGSQTIINGTFDWVYEEELNCRDGFRWSNDNKQIVFWHSDTEGTGKFSMINNVDSLYPKVIELPYPKVGTANSAVKIGVVSIADGQTKWFDLPGDPRNHYLARIDMVPNSNKILIQQLNRLQNQNRVFLSDMTTMVSENIYTDKDNAFLEVNDDIQWLDNNRFTWVSEKDGWRHLYSVSLQGKEVAITKGDFDVIDVKCTDIKGGVVYYIASPQSATERYLYKSQLSGKGDIVKVTPAKFVGHNDYQISEGGKWAIHTFNNSTTPNRYSMVNLKHHKEVSLLEENRELKKEIDQLQLTNREFIKIDIGDIALDGWMIRPIDFDSTKKYPVIVYIYGEPAGTTVQNNWGGGELWSHYLSQQGYIVMSIDPRGTKTPRGREWRKSIYGKIGIVAPEDHAKAMMKVIDTYRFIDGKRIGIWGWSGGGQMTLNCLFKHPEIYSAGIAVAFVSDQRLYDTIYQERYMGLPSGNKEGYFNGSPINFAQNLKGKLMIIHGTGDDNVHYQSFEMLTNRLIKNKKVFSQMSYPMRGHGIFEGENTTIHLYMTMENFWLNNLTPGAK